jgi:acrylyl-CoA reductase (NADPH)
MPGINPTLVRCYLVEKDGETIKAGLRDLSVAQLPPGDLLISVAWSALNYKDALAATGHPGVALKLPLVPGIDAVGTVMESDSMAFPVGRQVIVKAADFGTRSWGGWSNVIRVPADWCYSLPDSMKMFDAAAVGTAGFTAAQCVDQLLRHNVHPDSGPVVVSGSTGGVGICAVMILAKLGYHVVAATGKPDRIEWLRELGAREVISRQDLNDESGRPLLSAKWAGGVDTAGGNTLSTLLRQTQMRGCVTACGLVDSPGLNMTVYPFILRGVTLQGVDSANTPRDVSERIWGLLAGSMSIDKPERFASAVPLFNIDVAIRKILKGEVAGRFVVSTTPRML